MDIKHLTTFITFVEEKSYIKAAMKLNYAASTLTEHMSALEQELGVKLVESHGKRTVVTKAGVRFLPYAQEMLALYRKTLKDMAAMNMVKGQLRVMAVESLGLYGMSGVFAKFMSCYPEVTLSISIGNCNDIYNKLRNDEIDAAYVYDMRLIKETDLLACELFREPLCFVVSPQHKLAGRQRVIPGDFDNQIFVLAQKDCYYARDLDRMLRIHNVRLKNTIRLDSGNMIKKYVCEGYGISLLPYSVVQEEIDCGKLAVLNVDGEKMEAVAQAVVIKNEWMLPAVKALLNMS